MGVVAFTFLCRAAFVLLPAWLMGMPRLGDDALVYLWKGKHAYTGYDRSLPALRDIQAQRDLTDEISPAIETHRWRATISNVGPLNPFYDLLVGAMLRVGLGWRWAFAAAEVLIAFVASVAIASFLAVLVGPLAAGFGLLVLAFPILPGQGLHYFIASTLAMAIGLLLWAYLLARGERASRLVVWGAAFYLCGLHLLGKAYLLGGLAAQALSFVPVRKAWARRQLVLYGGCIAVIGVWLVLPVVYPPLALPRAGGDGVGRYDLAKSLDYNLPTAGEFMLVVLGQSSLAVALSLIALARGRGLEIRWRAISAVAVVWGGATIVSLAHRYEMPADAFARALVPLVVVAAGLGGAVLACWWSSGGRTTHALIGLVLTAWVAWSLFHWTEFMFGNMNRRASVIREQALEEEVHALGPGPTTILYIEDELALRAMMIAGAARHHALNYFMHGPGPVFREALDRTRPPVAVAAEPRTLNSLAMVGSRALEPRRSGFWLQAVDQLVLDRSRAGPFPGLRLHIDNAGPAFPLRVTPGTTNAVDGRVEITLVPARFRGWLDVAVPTGEAVLKIEGPRVPAWIGGIATGPPLPHVVWPWADQLVVTYRGRDNRRKVQVDFSIPGLVTAQGAAGLLSFFDLKATRVTSDRSGIVFLAPVYRLSES